MMFYCLIQNCVKYVSTMENILVTGFDWTNIKAIADISKQVISKPMFRRLRHVESLVIKESVENARKRNEN